MNGSARTEPLYSRDKETYRFEPDATNVFVVLATQNVFHDMFARYFIAPLLCFYSQGEPELEVVKICFFITETHVGLRTFHPVGGWGDIRKKDLKFIEGRKIGNVRVDQDRVCRAFPPA